MRRFILGSALAFCALLPALSQTTCPATVFTPNLNLSLPALGTKNWNLCLNPNFQVIDAAIAQLQSPFLGPWSSSTVYTKGSFVSFNNAIYISSIFSNFNNTPSAGSTAWQLFLSTDGGGGGGSCGPQSDTSNTDCGTANQVGLISDPPANVSTFGVDNVADASNATFVVAIGNDNYIGDVSDGGDVVAIGDANATTTGQDLFKAVLMGRNNMGQSACTSTQYVGIGDTNFPSCPSRRVGDVVDIGDDNDDFSVGAGIASNLFGPIVAIGVHNDSNDRNTTTINGQNEVVAVGDTTVNSFTSCTDCVGVGDFTLMAARADGVEANDIVAIGDVVAEGILNGTNTMVCIGVAPCELNDGALTYGGNPPQEVVGIGESVLDNSVGSDIVAMGDSVLDGGSRTFSINFVNSGHDLVALGNHDLAENSIGTDNVAIGDFAGCVGCTNGARGFGNRGGSHNVWIGDTPGPATTTDLDFTVGIGYHAQMTVPNSVTLGSKAENFDNFTFGTIHTDSLTSPTASSGTLVGTNNGGAISGLSAATSVTVTFAGGAGFTEWTSCTANASAASTPVAVSALSLTAVTFSFPSLTGSLYFHCDGN